MDPFQEWDLIFGEEHNVENQIELEEGNVERGNKFLVGDHSFLLEKTLVKNYRRFRIQRADFEITPIIKTQDTNPKLEDILDTIQTAISKAISQILKDYPYPGKTKVLWLSFFSQGMTR